MNRLLLAGAAVTAVVVISTGIPPAHADPGSADPVTDSYHATCAELHLLSGEEPHDLSLATQVAFTIKAYYRSLDQAPGTPGVQVMSAQAQIQSTRCWVRSRPPPRTASFQLNSAALAENIEHVGIVTDENGR